MLAHIKSLRERGRRRRHYIALSEPFWPRQLVRGMDKVGNLCQQREALDYVLGLRRGAILVLEVHPLALPRCAAQSCNRRSESSSLKNALHTPATHIFRLLYTNRNPYMFHCLLACSCMYLLTATFPSTLYLLPSAFVLAPSTFQLAPLAFYLPFYLQPSTR